MFNGKIHYKWPFSIAMLVHQRVNLGLVMREKHDLWHPRTIWSQLIAVDIRSRNSENRMWTPGEMFILVWLLTFHHFFPRFRQSHLKYHQDPIVSPSDNPMFLELRNKKKNIIWLNISPLKYISQKISPWYGSHFFFGFWKYHQDPIESPKHV